MRKVIKEAVAINDEIVLTPGDEIDILESEDSAESTSIQEEDKSGTSEVSEDEDEEPVDDFEDRVSKLRKLKQ